MLTDWMAQFWGQLWRWRWRCRGISGLLCGLVWLGWAHGQTAPSASASSPDKKNRLPVHIEAHSLYYDKSHQTSILEGAVRLDRGDAHLSGQRAFIQQRPDGYVFARIEGSSSEPAFYQQTVPAQPHNDQAKFSGPVDVQAKALHMTYDTQTEVLEMHNQVVLKRYQRGVLTEHFTGDHFIYTTSTQALQTSGDASAKGAKRLIHVTLSPLPELAASSRR
jgi:lipopolysaccharide transport protein LptA